jgi:hypothetical protein
MLSMKAEILNDVFSILPYVTAFPMEEARRDRLLNSLYQIVDTMGIPGDIYGLEVGEDGQARFPEKKHSENPTEESVPAKTAPPKTVSVAKTGAIGFLAGPPPQRDLPDGVHRSIGFGAHKINEEKPPRRKGGFIQRSVSNDNPDRIMILDGETGDMYVLPVSRVAFLGGQIDGKVYRLDFNADTLEWIVAVENLNNPSGRIGF